MVALRERMLDSYEDWWEDLPAEPIGVDGQAMPGWRTFFAECPALDFGAIKEDLQIADVALVWPGRRNIPNGEAPQSAHICRAFERIEPEGVRVVVLGQDLYPVIAQATGRAFEDGAWDGERTEDMAGSLKSLMLAAVATRGGHADLFRPGSWPEVRRQIRDGELVFPALSDYFITLAGQGVLFVNAAWTRTADEHLVAHRSLWKPVLDYMLGKLAQNNQPVVFLLLGGDASEAVCAADPVCNRSAIVNTAHPGRWGFLRRRNPLVRVNHALGELGADPVPWWPDPPPGPV